MFRQGLITLDESQLVCQYLVRISQVFSVIFKYEYGK